MLVLTPLQIYAAAAICMCVNSSVNYSVFIQQEHVGQNKMTLVQNIKSMFLQYINNISNKCAVCCLN